MATNENVTAQETEKIEETALAVQPKEPVWKTALKILGYVAAAVAGAVTTMLVSNLRGDDDDDDETPATDTKE